ncbi:glycoside hydrolase family 10 protein [Tundrisphaera sp. TA3]|uniref:glycoside hydrolase family 10 protein n=1 Tax=Tundrisphaera sp. TA3 TaxID=3435775 RepID=UPI003EBDA849
MIAHLLCLATLAAAPAPPDAPPIPREFRAVWVATVENIDWPTKPGLPVATQKAEAIAILDSAARLNLNAVVLQVRTAADALYDSPIEPWSHYLTGKQGQAPEPYYDPLQFWIEEAHRRGLTLHAWLNPFRSKIAGARYEDAASHVDKARPDLAKAYGTMRWMDPGEPDAFDQTLRVVADLAKRYDLDGLHIDDYFYPYPIADPARPGQELPFPDDPSWKKAQEAGYKGERNDWRRGNINRLIRAMAEKIRAERPTALFGISPFGIPRPGQPEGVKGFDQYDKLYADAVLWLKEGWCDYIAPQLYWKVDSPGQPFRPLLNYWIEQNTHKRHVWPGLSSSRVGTGEKSYRPDEIFRQIEIIRETPGATGNILFSQKSLRPGPTQFADKLVEGLYREPAIIPTSPWLGSKPPEKPKVLTTFNGGNPAFKPLPSATPPFVWVIQIRRGEAWETLVRPYGGESQGFGAIDAAGIQRMVVTAVDRLGNASEPTIVELEAKP